MTQIQELKLKQAQFIFTTCQVGAEKALKNEIARKHPELKFSFSRPGFVTFKSDKPLDLDFKLNSIFARTYGLSVGRIDSKSDRDIDYAGEVLSFAQKVRGEFKLPRLHIHIFERDQYVSGEEPKTYKHGTWSELAYERVKSKIKENNLKEFSLNSTSVQNGDLVLDVVIVEENAWWFGLHKHSELRPSFVGGIPTITLPESAPSRAYLKLEEALAWIGVKPKNMEIALDLGCAPGGASLGLLTRGLRVVGIDPGKMDEDLMKKYSPHHFKHVQRAISQVSRKDLPSKVDWIFVDLNVGPDELMLELERYFGHYKNSLQGVFLTLKINNWDVASEIPRTLASFSSLGFETIRARQLFYNRQEICVFLS